MTQVADSIPRVLLLGRLSLYGGRAERLHEEIVPVAARWTEPSLRQRPLAPYAAEATSRTWDLLEQSLDGRRDLVPSAEIKKRLLDATACDIKELLPQLETRAWELAERVVQQLRERGDREARELRETLDRQRQRVQDELAKTRPQHRPARFQFQ